PGVLHADRGIGVRPAFGQPADPDEGTKHQQPGETAVADHRDDDLIDPRNVEQHRFEGDERQDRGGEMSIGATEEGVPRTRRCLVYWNCITIVAVRHEYSPCDEVMRSFPLSGAYRPTLTGEAHIF